MQHGGESAVTMRRGGVSRLRNFADFVGRVQPEGKVKKNPFTVRQHVQGHLRREER